MDTAPKDTEHAVSENTSSEESVEEQPTEEALDASDAILETPEAAAGCSLTVLSSCGMLFLLALGGVSLKKKH